MEARAPSDHVNLKLLHTFLLVGEHSSFKIAAERSFRSQSAVSAQIRLLEEQLGVALFHRTTRNVRLTSEGEQLMECASRALMEVNSGLRNIRESADFKRGRVALSCSPTVAETRLARVLSAFEREYPNIEVLVQELTSEALFNSIRKHEVDFGIGPKVETSEFHFDPILEDPLYALVPKHFLKWNQDTIPLATVSSMPLLLLNQATALRGMLESITKERNLSLRTRYQFAQAQTLISMANEGLGVAVLPKVTMPKKVSNSVYALRIVNPEIVRQICIITAKGTSLSPASLRLTQLMKQVFERSAARTNKVPAKRG